MVNKCRRDAEYVEREETVAYIKETYGMEWIGISTYTIVDASKFTIFQLKYPEHIRKIGIYASE
jgi:hypothetical protein